MTPPDRHKHSMIIQRRSVLIADILEKAYNTEKRGGATLKNVLHYFTQQDEESYSDSTFVRIALGSQ